MTPIQHRGKLKGGNSQMTKEKIIYTTWVAYELRKQGFKILRTEPSPSHPELDCWIFMDTKEFRQALRVISQKGRK